MSESKSNEWIAALASETARIDHKLTLLKLHLLTEKLKSFQSAAVVSLPQQERAATPGFGEVNPEDRQLLWAPQVPRQTQASDIVPTKLFSLSPEE